LHKAFYPVKIAETIIDKQADYILALKGNHGYLKEDVQSTFLRQQPDSTDETVEKGHGRIETRKCEVINKLDFLNAKEQWAGLRVYKRILIVCKSYIYSILTG